MVYKPEPAGRTTPAHVSLPPFLHLQMGCGGWEGALARCLAQGNISESRRSKVLEVGMVEVHLRAHELQMTWRHSELCA